MAAFGAVAVPATPEMQASQESPDFIGHWIDSLDTRHGADADAERAELVAKLVANGYRSRRALKGLLDPDEVKKVLKITTGQAFDICS